MQDPLQLSWTYLLKQSQLKARDRYSESAGPPELPLRRVRQNERWIYPMRTELNAAQRTCRGNNSTPSHTVLHDEALLSCL